MEALASVLLVLGSALALIAAIGLQRFDDVLSRMHAATKPATLGLLLTLTGAALTLPIPGAVVKLILVILFQFITAPVGAHLVGRAAFQTGQDMSPDTVLDDGSEQIKPA